MLADTFCANARDVVPSPALQRRLEELLSAAQATWPQLRVSEDAFAAHLARCAQTAEGLRALDAAALYLCCGCAAGDLKALALFEETVMRGAAAAVFRMTGSNTAAVDDILQRLREKLFAGPSPRVLEYAGRGELSRWVCAVASREALNALGTRTQNAPRATEDVLGELRDASPDPERAALQQQLSAHFKGAVRQSLAELPPAARLELHQYYVEGQGLDELARLYRVAPSTISRRLAKSRALVLARTHGLLVERLSVTPAEVESLIRALKTRLELSDALFSDG